MREEGSVSLIETARNTFKMTKTRAAMFLVVLILSCALVLSITDAYPTPEAEPAALESDAKLGNNSRLVITHVVKTIEFEVGIVDADDLSSENSTDSEPSEFYETDIHLLNMDLLKEVVNQASSDESNGEVIKESLQEQHDKNAALPDMGGQSQQEQNVTNPVTEKSTS